MASHTFRRPALRALGTSRGARLRKGGGGLSGVLSGAVSVRRSGTTSWTDRLLAGRLEGAAAG